MGLSDIFKGIRKKHPTISNEEMNKQLTSSVIAHYPQSPPNPPQKEERKEGAFLDPFAPRSTDNLPPQPNIQEVPPPLPRRDENMSINNTNNISSDFNNNPYNTPQEVRDNTRDVENVAENRADHLDPLLPPQARSALSPPSIHQNIESERSEEYGIIDDNTVERARQDRIEEIINDLRFLRAQNDMILEILKRIERKLP